MSDSLRPQELQHIRPPCLSPTPRVYPNSCPLSQWWHPTILSSYHPLIQPIFAWNIPLLSLIFLKRSLVFPILLFSSISSHWSLRKAFFISPCYSLELCIQMVYLSFSPLLFTSLLSSAIYKASSENHFAYLHFFFLGIVSVTVSCTMLWTPSHSSLGTLSTRSNPLNLFNTFTV